ncbi:MAG: HD domain-containing protein [Eubacterium sp.]|nr:HD domain-containing protein [Eubacterium sp.]
MTVAKERANIDRFLEYTGDLLRDQSVQSMKEYKHHREVSTHFHSLFVSYTVMKLCERFHAKEERQIVRAALLHDFYLYEWYTEKHEEKHIWYHPKQSVKNIEARFGALSEMQRNMILAHMFPMSYETPASTGAWLLTLADKHCATSDYTGVSKRFMPVYEEINKRIEA